MVQVCPSLGLKAIHLPRQIRDPLLDEMETCVLGTLIDVEREKVLLSNVFILCALLANFICGSTLIRFLTSVLLHPMLFKFHNVLRGLLTFKVQNAPFLSSGCQLLGTYLQACVLLLRICTLCWLVFLFFGI